MKKIYVWLLLSSCVPFAGAHEGRDGLFDQIAKQLAAGDVEALSESFSTTVELDLLGDEGMYSKAQATLVLKQFFERYTPKTFSFKHCSDKQSVKYAVGVLHTRDGTTFRVTVFVKEDGDLKMQQLRIEKH
ncbi:MAG: DUF4783 domain-containing protein [Prevotellaceae bacterium]|jgi:hypothetical protein|nr:DUF4783 domain-containing protein [Prevotellaceae bacterium]